MISQQPTPAAPADDTPVPAECVFCAIINGQAPGEILKRWDNAVAIVPLTPVVDRHVLIIPTLHVTHAGQDPEVTGDTMACAAEYAGVLHDSFNLITSAGRAATQSIGHLHIHVVPRSADDKLMTPWGTIYGDDPTAPHWCRVAAELSDTLASRVDYKLCTTAAGWGECVLADGHETRESEHVGGMPCTSHVDRWGQSWGVAGGGS